MFMRLVLIGVNIGFVKIQQSVAVFMTIIFKGFCRLIPRQVYTDV